MSAHPAPLRRSRHEAHFRAPLTGRLHARCNVTLPWPLVCRYLDDTIASLRKGIARAETPAKPRKGEAPQPAKKVGAQRGAARCLAAAPLPLRSSRLLKARRGQALQASEQAIWHTAPARLPRSNCLPALPATVLSSPLLHSRSLLFAGDWGGGLRGRPLWWLARQGTDVPGGHV